MYTIFKSIMTDLKSLFKSTAWWGILTIINGLGIIFNIIPPFNIIGFIAASIGLVCCIVYWVFIYRLTK
jgi:hypothetical protein